MNLLTVQNININFYAELSRTPYKKNYLSVYFQETFPLTDITTLNAFLKKYRTPRRSGTIVPIKFSACCDREILREPFKMYFQNDSNFDLQLSHFLDYYRNGVYCDPKAERDPDYDICYILYLVKLT